MSLFKYHPEPYPEAPVWRARGHRAVDGDTCEILVDLGFDVSAVITVRVEGVNCPEMVGSEREQGILAKAFTAAAIEGAELRITTQRFRRTFSRYVAKVEFYEPPQFTGDVGKWYDLATELIRAGHGKAA